jgi:hypothetical protein
MKSFYPLQAGQSGNVFLYVLIAVILFGALTYALSQSAQQGDSVSELDQGRVNVAVNSILAYAGSAQNAINNMDISGSDADELDFIRPDDAAFDTAPNLHKIFHPDGGGLNLKSLPADSLGDAVTSPANGFYLGRFNNVEWTPTTTNDVIFAAYGLNRATCAALNQKITGSSTIPSITAGAVRRYFVDDAIHGGGNVDLTVAACAACDGRPALCVSNGANIFVYYTLLVAR